MFLAEAETLISTNTLSNDTQESTTTTILGVEVDEVDDIPDIPGTIMKGIVYDFIVVIRFCSICFNWWRDCLICCC